MSKRIAVESSRDRRALVADAGWGRLSLASVLAGVLVAYGAFAVLTGIAAGVLKASGAGTDITGRWGDLGVTAGLVVAGLLFLSYLFGGYVAGRMARRAGVLNGAGVFLLGLLVVGAVALLVRQAAGTEAVVARLRDLGLPTTGDEWRHVGTVAGLASLAAVFVGSVLGGALGERWHARLLSRAVDPDVGAEAEARRQAALAETEARLRHTGSHDRADTASLRRLREDDRALEGGGHVPADHGRDDRGPTPAVTSRDVDAERRAAAEADLRAQAPDRAGPRTSAGTGDQADAPTVAPSRPRVSRPSRRGTTRRRA